VLFIPLKKHRIPEPRKQRQITQKNFVLYNRARAQENKTGIKWKDESPGTREKVYPKAFGIRKVVSGPEFIGVEGPVSKENSGLVDYSSNKTRHWFVDRRIKKGTVADRK